MPLEPTTLFGHRCENIPCHSDLLMTQQLKHEATGGVFRETQSSKTRAEAINSRGGGKKKSMELVRKVSV